jgi:hypothetical protein
MKPLNKRKPDCHRVNYFRTVARVELDNWTGHKFTDMFTLLKTDGQWKIISKVFYLHP